MSYPVGAIANEFLDLAGRDGCDVNLIKLQRLVYLAHGWHLGILGEPLIDTVIQAWRFGPVISDLYHEFKSHGRNPIKDARFTKAVQLENGEWRLYNYKLSLEHTDAHAIVSRVWEVYKHLSDIQLSKLCYCPGSPWEETWNSMTTHKIRGKEIPNMSIEKYFHNLVVCEENV